MQRVALILGVTGQDGSYMAKLLIGMGYAVHGTSRDAKSANLDSLMALGISEQIDMHSVSLSDIGSIVGVINRVTPSEIYNLAGPSSVGTSFQQPWEAFESIAVGTLNVLEAIRRCGHPIRLYNASSSECFGDLSSPATEITRFCPRSPYGVSKAAAFWQVVNYRSAYRLFACSGILFNHESPMRPSQFVTRKIAAAAARIAFGSQEKLKLGNLAIRRDWGWAPEYVDAMWRILQQQEPDDYVIATGISYTLEEFVSEAFSFFDLDWHDHVVSDPGLFRPNDIMNSYGNADKAAARLGWKAGTCMPEVAKRMVEAEVARNWLPIGS
jgi:GDPmannose 4,6-dehydratase